MGQAAADLNGQLRGLVLQNISHAKASSEIVLLDLAANQSQFAAALVQQLQTAEAYRGRPRAPRSKSAATRTARAIWALPIASGTARPSRPGRSARWSQRS